MTVAWATPPDPAGATPAHPAWAATIPPGFHWAASLRRPPLYLNVPYWPHRIWVIGWGRLDRHGTFRHHQPCAYRMHLHHCCPEASPP
jgi:hypothetical protein